MLVSAVGRLFRGRPVAIFLSGLIAGIFTSVAMTGGGYAAYRFPQTQPPSHISQLRAQGVSHNPEILKRVLATRDVLPHVTQISMATIKPGQVATENFHHDMVEMFVFLSGHGILRLDDTNHTVKEGSFATIFPTTRHTIFNGDAEENLRLLTIASVP